MNEFALEIDSSVERHEEGIKVKLGESEVCCYVPLSIEGPE